MKAMHLFALVLSLALIGSAVQPSFAATEKTQKTDIAKLTKDPKFVKSLIEYMKKNHDFAQDVVVMMLKDPMLRIQIIGHMTENKDAMKQMTQMMSGNNTKDMKMDHSKTSKSTKSDHSMSMKKDIKIK